MTIFKWRDEGSTTVLRDFIRQIPLTKVLTTACQHFQLKVGTDFFLGAGSFSFVFRTTRSDGKSVALKVVDGSQDSDGVLRLEREKDIMTAAHNACPDVVMGVEEDGFAIFEDDGILLLSQVGGHYSKLDPQSIVDSLKTAALCTAMHAWTMSCVWMGGQFGSTFPSLCFRRQHRWREPKPTHSRD